ncbi:hypothetical protein ACWGD3_47290, partial [Streptomyces sp. NPDC055006]
MAQLEKTENGWWWAGNSTRRRDLLSLPFPHPESYEDADDELYLRLPQGQRPGTQSPGLAQRAPLAVVLRLRP